MNVSASDETTLPTAPDVPAASSTAKWKQQGVLSVSDHEVNEGLGTAVAISGNTAVVGTPQASIGSSQFQGAAYVFVRSSKGWTQTAKLTASNGKARDFFGCSVSISGNTIVVGAYGASVGTTSDSGAAYVFAEPATGWANMKETAILSASNPKTGDQLGFATAISDDTITVGAPRSQKNGVAYVFVKPTSGWSSANQTATLTTSDGSDASQFGWSTDISGKVIVAGSPIAHAIYLFVEPKTGWTNATQTAKLASSDKYQLGYAVATDGSTVVAGTPGISRTYLFLQPSGGWVNMTESAQLTASDWQVGDDFGRTVAISDGVVVAGAHDATIGKHPGQGEAYIFVKPPLGWTNMKESDRLTINDGNSLAYFGKSVAVADGTVLVGAPNERIGCCDYGAVYVFDQH